MRQGTGVMRLALLLALGAGCTGSAAAAPMGSGTFASDHTIKEFDFTVNSNKYYTFSTSSYATGGFVPVLTLALSNGAILADDGGDGTCQAGMSASASTGMCDDALLTYALGPGSYELFLTEFPNFANTNNISGGFFLNTNGLYTSDFCGTSGNFWETDVAPCVQRTGHYALSVATSATPEPGTLGLLVLPAVLLVGFGRRMAA